MATADDNKMIKILVKTPQIKETIEINEKAKIQELKALVSEKFATDLDRLCLIFAGKILKDNETLEQHKITDGLTIHLVIRPKKKAENQTTSNNESTNTTTPTPSTTNTSTTNTTSSTTNTNPLGGFMGGLGDLGSFGRDIFNNPELTQQLFNNPLIQDIMSNPDNIRTMLSMNPQMQQLIERNPEINHLLNNNDILRHSMEMMRNPSAFQELMRTQDRALSNLESLPGGYNALRRMYTELQEPMLNAASEQLTGENPFASFARQNNSSTNNSSTNVQAGTENRDPLPNPWSRDTNTTSSTTTTGSNPLSNPLAGNRNSNPFSQLLENRDFMNSMLNSPHTQQMMQQMSSNPEFMQRIMANNPLLSNSNLQQQMNAFQQLQTPEIRQAISNPEALEAMMQITRGMETLQRVAPGLFNTMMSGNLIGTPLNTTNSATTTTTNTSSTNSSTLSSGNPVTGNQQQPNLSSISQLNNLMSQMFAGSGGLNSTNPTSNNPQPPEERYRSQLDQLNAMGFTDRQQNLNALIETFGDVNGAIERLLNTGDLNRGSYFS